jgi:hypothetical protein
MSRIYSKLAKKEIDNRSANLVNESEKIRLSADPFGTFENKDRSRTPSEIWNFGRNN